MRYDAVYELKSLGLFSTFAEAFKAIYDEIKKSSVISWQILEIATWITNEDSGGAPISFYDARDIMCEIGYLVDGKWVEK
jgi:hypothetical protein